MSGSNSAQSPGLAKALSIILIIYIYLQAVEQAKRYDGLASQCKTVSGTQDLTYFVRSLPMPPNAHRIPRKIFAPPQPPQPVEGEEIPDYNVCKLRWVDAR